MFDNGYYKHPKIKFLSNKELKIIKLKFIYLKKRSLCGLQCYQN